LNAILLVPLGVMAALAAALVGERRRRRRTESRNRGILSSLFGDLAVLTREGVLDTCNENWSRSSRTSNPFTSAGIGDRWPPAAEGLPAETQADLRRLRDALDAVLTGGEIERVIECSWQADLSRKRSRVRLRRLDDPGGGAVVVHLDITASKQSEGLALHELAHTNMRAVMGELASTITHEVAQSLTASLGNAQALKRMLAAGRLPDGDLSAIVTDIIDANRQATEVIERIRTVMRKEEFDLQPLDLNAIVMDVVQMLYSSAANQGLLLLADLDPELPSISGDRVELRQVAMNLVLNAVQATRASATTQPIVRVATATVKDGVSLIVDDAGPGVAEDILPRLFEPYFTTKTNGLGVGLSISRSIVQSHGGSIAVTNRPEGGARFHVTLPLQ
jgi:signal transduction histidine kinase